MTQKRPALGRGLAALIPDAPVGRDPIELDIDRLVPNPQQPRMHPDEAGLDELAQSIQANGVIQPIVVRRRREGYEIIAGERRWRAAQRAGLLRVPVTVRDVPDDRLLEFALIENIQRQDLNPIEEALAYRKLVGELGLTQEQVAAAVGKDRSSVANYLRLLKLPEEVRSGVAAGSLSMGHARALLSLPDEAQQRRIGRDVIARELSVRETEAMVRHQLSPVAPVEKAAVARTDPNTLAAEERLRFALGSRVRIVRRGKRGRIEIDFSSEEELQRLFEQLTA
jgi:ParB family chromosome partitioning protein